MTLDEFSLYIICVIFILLFSFFSYSLCFRNKKVATISVEKYNPRILIADNGITIVQTDPIQDYCAICEEEFKGGDSVKILNCDHIYHRNCYEEKMGCVKCLTSDYNEHTHLLV